MRLRWFALPLVVLACSQPAPTTTGAVPLSLPASTAVSTEVAVTVQDCETPPLPFAVLCESFELLIANHVKEVTATDLAEAAVAPIAGYRDPLGEEPAALDRLTCAIPTEEFRRLCDSIEVRLEEGPADLAGMLEAAVESMVSRSYDPYTAYLGPDVLDAVGENGVLPAVGILASAQDAAGSHCVLISTACPLKVVIVLDGSPAEKAGLLVGDQIGSVDGVGVDGLTLFQVADVLAGDEGSEVLLEVTTDGQTRTVSLLRGSTAELTVTGEIVKKGVGYIRIPEFTFDAQVIAHFVLVDLADKKARTVIMDLRDNPGGLVDGAVSLASEFLPSGNVLEAQYRDGFEEKYPTRDGGVFTKDSVDLIVLVNEGSASSSEILAAVLKERKRALIVGQPTFGKNLIQLTYPLHNGGQLRVTIATWTTPKGRSVEDGGLKPDVLAELPLDLELDELIDRVLKLV